MLALIRTAEWETPLFIHVLAAMLLMGGLFAVGTALVAAWRAEEGDAAALTRFAYRTLFILVLPAFVAMRIGAQWVLEEAPVDEDEAWIGVGYIVSDAGGLLLLVSLILAGLGLRRAGDGRGRTAARVVTVVTLLVLAAYLVAIWAMTTKPT